MPDLPDTAGANTGDAGARVRWGSVFAAVMRESRAARGRLLFFTLCLAIGVAAVVGVSALVSSIEAGMREESRDLLAADLRVTGRRPLPDELDAFLAGIEHERADVRELAAMASVRTSIGARAGTAGDPPFDRESASGRDSRLVELKVVDGEYPFYGTLEVSTRSGGPTRVSELAPDELFAAPELLLGLGAKIGDELSIGGASFRVAGEVLDEPDRVDFALTLGPRVFLTRAGFERTSLQSALNRVQYRVLVRLSEDVGREELERLEEELEAALEPFDWVRVTNHTDAQPNVRRPMRRVEDYLGLVALLSLLLGGIGVSQVVRAWLAGRAQSVAVMRCLGYRAREIAGVYLGHVALLAVAGCLVGGALGALLPAVVRELAPELFRGGAHNLWQPLSLARGVGLGLAIALLFSLTPLASVWRVPPAAVLRAEAVPLRAPRLVRFGGPLVLALGVLLVARVQGGSWIASSVFSAGLLVLAGLLFGAARSIAWLSGRLPRGRLGPHLEHGLAALARPGSGTSGAIVALGIGVLVVVSLVLVEKRLGDTLRGALPEDAPSVFLVDVQPDQWGGVRAAMEERGARSIDSTPVVMARLRRIDGRDVAELAQEARDDDRASWVFTREQRLTWRETLPADNVIVAGALWTDPERAEVSVEQSFAEDLGVGVGSVLLADVQGIQVELLVSSVRTVEWQSFGINFFLVVEPGVLEDAPHFRIAAARLDTAEQEYALQNELAASFANVTMLRVRSILEKIAGVLSRAAFGVRALMSFAIATGLVILAGSVGTTALRRAREAALLKTLGVTRTGVARLFAVEYALSGAVAGALGASGALLLARAFLEELLELPGDVPLSAVPIAAAAAALLATLSGLAASVRALRARPMETLRG